MFFSIIFFSMLKISVYALRDIEEDSELVFDFKARSTSSYRKYIRTNLMGSEPKRFQVLYYTIIAEEKFADEQENHSAYSHSVKFDEENDDDTNTGNHEYDMMHVDETDVVKHGENEDGSQLFDEDEDHASSANVQNYSQKYFDLLSFFF
jgi:hypothetical protein